MSADFQPGMEPTGNRPLSYNVILRSASAIRLCRCPDATPSCLVVDVPDQAA